MFTEDFSRYIFSERALLSRITKRPASRTLTADTLAVPLCASPLPTRTRDLHPLENSHAGQTKAAWRPCHTAVSLRHTISDSCRHYLISVPKSLSIFGESATGPFSVIRYPVSILPPITSGILNMLTSIMIVIPGCRGIPPSQQS